MTTPVPVHLMLSGGASLGSFHGGALAALLSALRVPAAEGVVRIDAIGGTSAGAIAGLLAAHSWLEGIDPAWVMHEAWVERVSASLLRTRRAEAPFSFERLRDHLPELLDRRAVEQHGVPPADRPLVLHANLLNLHGLPYDLPVEGDNLGATFDDWAQFEMHPGGGMAQLTRPEGASPLDAVLASASNPGLFGPMSLDRSADADVYRANGITHLPDSGIFWYSDGGPLTNEPVGRVVRAGARVRDGDQPEQVVTLVLDPRSEGPTDTAFTGDEDPPSWLAAVARTLSLMPAQAISDDLRRIGKHNARIEQVTRVADAILEEFSEEEVGRLREVVGTALDGEDGIDASTEPSVQELLSALGGVEDKARMVCDQISPKVYGDEPTGAYLSGDLLGDFGGFLSRELRHNDFLLGFDCASHWFERRARHIGLDEEVYEAALEDLRDARPDGEVDLDISRRPPLSAIGDAALGLLRVAASATVGRVRRGLTPW